MTTRSAARTADIEAIHQVVAAVEASQQAKDPDAFLSLFHPDALWTTGAGKVLIGLDAISEFTRAVLPGASWDGRVSYTVTHLQFLRPDVAAVKVSQVYLAADGPGDEGVPTYVMTKHDDGRWLLTVCQNTQVRKG
ncbi:SgcJ/EcaC family oxidoreductase [Streptomyces sp. WM6368]|uniref:SgcJ/EcaC family oxidoreductase n=1 Tax=Streptomyces sp. WM6368 TaxID=1415554 RepID=UPI0006AD9244|nr:SgcJ/EcaC family oxidoreductase [Streptomyces sp. WM6368]KOU22253.1 EcaC [Streptomyces sp. WM6368]